VVHHHQINAAQWIVYDALYAYAQEQVRQGRRDGAFKCPVTETS